MTSKSRNTVRNNSYASNDYKNNPHLFSDNVIINNLHWHRNIVVNANQSKKSFNWKNPFGKKKVQAGGGEGSGGNLGTVAGGALGGAAQAGAQALYGIS
jgi:hypothetical protein